MKDEAVVSGAEETAIWRGQLSFRSGKVKKKKKQGRGERTATRRGVRQKIKQRERY
jgi:hypothetical protein